MHLTVVCAASLDGKLASADRGPVTFPSRADRAHLFALRDQADALLVGAGTIRAEDPPLLPTPARRAARERAGLRGDPLRVVVSRTLDLPLAGRALVPRPDAPVVLLGPRDAPEPAQAAARAAGHALHLAGSGRVDLAAGLATLAAAHGLRRILCEGGGELNAALLAADLVDEVWLTLCPVLLGGARAPTLVDGPGLSAPRPAKLLELRRVDDELFLRYGLR